MVYLKKKSSVDPTDKKRYMMVDPGATMFSFNQTRRFEIH